MTRTPGSTTARNARTALAALLIFGLAACETVEGAGRDIQSAGAAVTESAQEAQR